MKYYSNMDVVLIIDPFIRPRRTKNSTQSLREDRVTGARIAGFPQLNEVKKKRIGLEKGRSSKIFKDTIINVI